MSAVHRVRTATVQHRLKSCKYYMYMKNNESVNWRLAQMSHCGTKCEQKESLQVFNISRSWNDAKGSVKKNEKSEAYRPFFMTQCHSHCRVSNI